MNKVPPVGTCFERVETRRGAVVARRVHKLVRSVIPVDPEINGSHTLVCVLDWRSGGNPAGIVGQSMTVECAWFEHRSDFKRVPTNRTAELLARAEADLAHFKRMHHTDGEPRLEDAARNAVEGAGQ